MSDTHPPTRQSIEEPALIDESTPIDEPAPIELAAEPFRLSSAPDEPPRVSRRWGRGRIALAAVLLVTVAGVAASGSAAWRIVQQKDASLTTPGEVAGLHRDDSDRARSTAEYLRDGMATDIELDRSVGAVYRHPDDAKRSVLLFGGTTLLWQPERDLDTLFELLSDESGTVTGLHEVPAGELGGVMKCGSTTGADDGFAVCGWADHGSVMMALFPGRSPDEAGDLLRQIRNEVQQRD